MNELLRWLGRIAGGVGLLLCAAAVLARLASSYWLAGFQVGTLLLAGTASLIAGCFFLLLVATRRSAER